MVVIFAMGIGLFAPPFGVGYYGACAVARSTPTKGIRYIWGYMAPCSSGWSWWPPCPGSPSAFLQVSLKFINRFDLRANAFSPRRGVASSFNQAHRKPQ
jgi:hypothetical protein